LGKGVTVLKAGAINVENGAMGIAIRDMTINGILSIGGTQTGWDNEISHIQFTAGGINLNLTNKTVIQDCEFNSYANAIYADNIGDLNVFRCTFRGIGTGISVNNAANVGGMPNYVNEKIRVCDCSFLSNSQPFKFFGGGYGSAGSWAAASRWIFIDRNMFTRSTPGGALIVMNYTAGVRITGNMANNYAAAVDPDTSAGGFASISDVILSGNIGIPYASLPSGVIDGGNNS